MSKFKRALNLNMSFLMKLPRELRDEIYNLVLTAEIEWPDVTEPFDELIRERLQYKKPRLEAICKVVLYSPGAASSNNLSLLLVNRQMHAETLENLEMIAYHPSYSLDIIVLDEVLLLPTWLSVPVNTTSIDTVSVTFRISGSYDARKEFDLE